VKRVFAVLAIIIIATVSVALLLTEYDASKNVGKKQEIYVGVTYCGNSVEDGKLLIDRVKGYTNLFVLQSGLLQRDLKSVDELGDYAVSAGLYFLPYFGAYVPPTFSLWLQNATHRWGTRFLGVYYGDEPGGKMLDDYVNFKDATNGLITKTTYGDIEVQKPDGLNILYRIDGVIHVFQPANATGKSSADGKAINETGKDVYATFYPNGTINVAEAGSLASTSEDVSSWGNLTYQDLMNSRPFRDVNEAAERFCAQTQSNIENLTSLTRVFTSDYALYWFDYLSGYNVVLAQIGWNNSFAQNIALVRGAAKLQSKDWGIDITWKYNSPPYLDNGSEIFSQMRTSYECGAKYIVLFNYYENDENPYGTLKDEHFLALENFWNEVVKNPNEIPGSTAADAALVLPKNYGWGMRWKEDKIWGIMKPDQNSLQIWDSLQNALANNGLHLDIVYTDPTFQVTGKYAQIIYWNQTT
jgi:hypothetical protein